jgi:hypothetical protein
LCSPGAGPLSPLLSTRSFNDFNSTFSPSLFNAPFENAVKKVHHPPKLTTAVGGPKGQRKKDLVEYTKTNFEPSFSNFMQSFREIEKASKKQPAASRNEDQFMSDIQGDGELFGSMIIGDENEASLISLTPRDLVISDSASSRIISSADSLFVPTPVKKNQNKKSKNRKVIKPSIDIAAVSSGGSLGTGKRDVKAASVMKAATVAKSVLAVKAEVAAKVAGVVKKDSFAKVASVAGAVKKDKKDSFAKVGSVVKAESVTKAEIVAKTANAVKMPKVTVEVDVDLAKKLPQSKAESRDNVRCKCKKSKCLKLYCDCFVILKLCNGCSCNDCHNDAEHEPERQAAIAATKARNPTAFLEKVSSSKEHMNGCNCKQSLCLKKYCECFGGGAHCGANCKCRNCQNKEGSEMLAKVRHEAGQVALHAAQRDMGRKLKVSTSPRVKVSTSPRVKVSTSPRLFDFKNLPVPACMHNRADSVQKLDVQDFRPLPVPGMQPLPVPRVAQGVGASASKVMIPETGTVTAAAAAAAEQVAEALASQPTGSANGASGRISPKDDIEAEGDPVHPSTSYRPCVSSDVPFVGTVATDAGANMHENEAKARMGISDSGKTPVKSVNANEGENKSLKRKISEGETDSEYSPSPKTSMTQVLDDKETSAKPGKSDGVEALHAHAGDVPTNDVRVVLTPSHLAAGASTPANTAKTAHQNVTPACVSADEVAQSRLTRSTVRIQATHTPNQPSGGIPRMRGSLGDQHDAADRDSLEHVSDRKATKEHSPTGVDELLSPAGPTGMTPGSGDVHTLTRSAKSSQYSKHRIETQNEHFQENKKRRVQFVEPPVEFAFFGGSHPCMPKLVALMILENLDGKGIYATSQVSTLWSSAAMDDALWED